MQAERSFFSKPRSLLYVALLVLYLLGIGFRLMNLTNPPLDFHAWRQLRAALMTRSYYYQLDPDIPAQARETAQTLGSFGLLEPPVTEALVALTYYVVGGEYLWISRIWTTLFWISGSIALFLLVKKMTSTDGAVVAVGYFLLLPFANTVTRAFLPEPLMIMWLLWALYAFTQWLDHQTWRWSITTGVLSGLAVFTKVFAVFPLGLAFLFASLSAFGFRIAFRKVQLWLIALITLLLAALFYILPDAGKGADYLGTWMLPYLRMLLDVSFYIGWLNVLRTFNLALVILGLASTILLGKNMRALVLGLWVGYLLFGCLVPELIQSHIYYNLILVPIVAISIAIPLDYLLKKVSSESPDSKGFVIAVIVVALGYTVFLSRKQVMAEDYRQEPARWQELAQLIPGWKVVGLTEDYNMRLYYYGSKPARQYPYSFDQNMMRLSGQDFDVTAENLEYFQRNVGDSEFFVVTMFDELEKQPYLKKILYEQYAIFAQGEGYIVFDLRIPK